MCRYAFNAWIPLITYNTEYAPRFLVGNTTTAALIICAALALTLAVMLQRRDAASETILLPGSESEDRADDERTSVDISGGK